MTRLRIALAVLIAFIDFTSTESIDGTFWNHDDDSMPDSVKPNIPKMAEPPASSSISLLDGTSPSADIHTTPAI
ncbi:unnamed protein product [Peronospora destructor]|uniref:Secreted protein n=1 Tax=Peronospora destructor TaxID=86335 RepID=A0AAV0SWX2_9STRA|nr:unnamed protein product [Peronospora destructor]